MIVGIDSQKSSVCPRLKNAIQNGNVLSSIKEKQKQPTEEDDDLLEAATPLMKPKNDHVMDKSRIDAGDSFHQIMIMPALMRGLKACLTTKL
ncbi:MAG: hypothetical protein R3B45_01115 [Bdellovibrionota bacterium]